ncbi:MAG: transglycosylase SLT domain-containing protein [Acidimicrobiia bacterium]
MGYFPLRGRRVAAASVSLLLGLMLAPIVAHAQPEVEEAEAAKQQADRFVTAAVANRDQVEADLIATLERYQGLSFELATVASGLDRLGELIARTGISINAARAAATEKAVEAYMQALSIPGGMLWSSESVEEAMVAGPTLAILAGADEDEAANLEASEQSLIALDAQYRVEFDQMETLSAQVQGEAARLQELFMIADQNVAAAIGDALAADAVYRAALDEVERARAAAAEQERQAERGTTTTTPPNQTSTTAGTTTAATATTPVVTTTTVPGSISRTLKPAVERWRSLTASYFSADLVDQALSIIQCESLGDPEAYNPYSGASGLFQFLPGTWAVTSPKAGFAGASPFDPEANIAAAAWLSSYYQSTGRGPWVPWYCQP